MLTVELDHESKMPLYEQLYVKIRDFILNGELIKGDRLPSEINERISR